MAAIILGKNLLSRDELIEFAFSELNTANLNLAQLTELTTEVACQSSLMLIQIMNAERIYVTTKPSLSKPEIGHSRQLQ